MTIEETKKILSILKINYPNSFTRLSDEDSHMYLSLWAESFKDTPTELVAMAVKHIINSDTREFAPNIAQVNEAIYKLTHREEMSEAEAINLIKKACANSGYHAQEEFDKLPATLKRLVGSPNNLYEWAMMDVNEFNTVIASNLSRSFKAIAKSEKEVAMLPNEIKNMIGSVEIKRIG